MSRRSTRGATKPVQVNPAYSYLSDKLRRMSAGSMQCSLFCGGHGCKYECEEKWSEEDKAMKGLFSHWVTADILAMARPSTELVQKGNLIDHFKRAGISSVINLQLPWEHAKCGPGLEQSSGFTYCPEDFMNNGVFFYNYGWVDYGVPTLTSMLDMVKVMDFALSEGKVAVHCHAGLGRTGALVACYLAYSLRLSGDDVIAMVREKRPGSIQTRPQIEMVNEFASFVSPLWTFFPNPSPSTPSLGLDDLLRNQTLVLHGPQDRNIKSIPKFLDEVCQRLMELKAYECDVLRSSLDSWCACSTLSKETQQKVEAIKEEVNGSIMWKLLYSEPSPSPLLHLLSCFLSTLKEPLLMSSDEVVLVISSTNPPLRYSPNPNPSISKPRIATALRVIDTLGSLLNAVTSGPTGSPIPLYRKVAVRLGTDLHQQKASAISDSANKTTVDVVMRYWKEAAPCSSIY